MKLYSATLFALGFAGALITMGCGRPFVPATPPGFVELDNLYEDNEYRAATADGVVLGIRVIDNEPKGETAFWVRAIENRMREVGGYALLEKREVKDRSGLAGTQLRFGIDLGKTPHHYWISIFTTEDRIFLLEAGGTKDEMARLAPQLEWSVRNFLHR
jgi:hypothetical protein